MASRTFLSFLLAAPVSASILFATSYNDHSLTTLSLNGSSLSAISTSYECGSEPTWLTLDDTKSILYCLNEGWGGNASITSYATGGNGTLAKLDFLPVLKSPVASTLFGPNNSELAVAFYDTSSFGIFSAANPKALTLLHKDTYTLAKPGPVSDRQEAPHLHDAILDPTKGFIIVPDLGSDLLRIFRIESASLSVTAAEPIKAVPGSGPRHGAFAVVDGRTFFYTVNELGNSITGYNVSYNNGSAPSFSRILDFNVHGPGGNSTTGAKAAEIVISPDQRFVIVSSRGENSVTIPNFDTHNTTALPSDPLITFSIDGKTGMLALVQTAPAGGRNPRGFSMNKAGTLIASALQDDNRVVVIERDVKTGLLGKIVAHATVGVGDGNGPNYALFNE